LIKKIQGSLNQIINKKINVMKNLAFIIVALLLAGGCATESQFVSSNGLSKATVDHPKTHKVWFESIPDEGKILECGLPAAGWITGHCNLMGEIVPEKSPFTVWYWYVDPKSDGSRVVESIEGTITGANGDSYFYTGIIITNMNDMSFSGRMYINGGIGTLDCIEGECFMKGRTSNGVSKWTARGQVAKRDESQTNSMIQTKGLSSY
jgi:hypothetical protein